MEQMSKTDQPAPAEAAPQMLPAIPFDQDPVMQCMVREGRLPPTWWTSNNAWNQLAKIAGVLAKSSMVPPDFRSKPENVMVALAAGMPLGLSPLACVTSVAVINAKPTLWGDAVMAQVLAHPSLDDIVEKEEGTIAAETRTWTITLKRKMPNGRVQSVTRAFSVADAKQAGLWKKAGPWSNYPDRMIYNRARAFAIRDLFADVLQGVTLAADNDEVVVDVVAEHVRTVRTAPVTSVDQTTTLAPDGAEPEPAEAPRLRKSRHTKGEPKTPRIGDTWGTDTLHVFVDDNGQPKSVAFPDASREQIARLQQLVSAQDNEHCATLFAPDVDESKTPGLHGLDEQEQARAAGALNDAMAKADRDDGDEPQPKKLVSAKGPTSITSFCESMDTLVDGAVHLDTTAMTCHLCNGEGWREVKPAEGVIYNAVSDFIAQALAKWLTKYCLSQRMDQQDAMDWAKELLRLEKAPLQFMRLTMTQLGELWHEAR